MVEQFTERENEIAGLISKGFSYKMIADQLCIDRETVSSHAKNMRKKIGGHSPVDIVRVFILSLENPRQYFAAVGFLIVVIFNLFFGVAMDRRVLNRENRVAFYRSVKPKNSKRCLDLV